MSAVVELPVGDNRLAVLADDLATRGWATLEDWLAPALLAALHAEAAAFADAPAGVGREDDHVLDRAVRRARLGWLDGTTPAQAAFLAEADALREALNARLFLGLFEFEAGFAVYPPGGFYARHRDSFRGAKNRVVSLVVYLDPAWDRAWGGALVVYDGDTDAVAAEVLPRAGTVVLMLSEEIDHEVRVTAHERRAVAAWWRVNQSAPDRVDPAA